jgi:hypothetical protein
MMLHQRTTWQLVQASPGMMESIIFQQVFQESDGEVPCTDGCILTEIVMTIPLSSGVTGKTVCGFLYYSSRMPFMRGMEQAANAIEPGLILEGKLRRTCKGAKLHISSIRGMY